MADNIGKHRHKNLFKNTKFKQTAPYNGPYTEDNKKTWHYR